MHPAAPRFFRGPIAMRSLALRGAVRRGVTRLHRWTGLVIMACLLLAPRPTLFATSSDSAGTVTS